MALGLNPASGSHQVISPLQLSHLEFRKKIFHEGCYEHEAIEAKPLGAEYQQMTSLPWWICNLSGRNWNGPPWERAGRDGGHRYRGPALERSFSRWQLGHPNTQSSSWLGEALVRTFLIISSLRLSLQFVYIFSPLCGDCLAERGTSPWALYSERNSDSSAGSTPM